MEKHESQRTITLSSMEELTEFLNSLGDETQVNLRIVIAPEEGGGGNAKGKER
jgi:hypothetical protein